ncbi:hypothetical protein cyc_01621 [Cyclospora cayetanensis]|uniref:Transmembrane protein n=1 Tax=Cyclospora cayetanensis TaxID=88456 RepID=A0A1D3D3Z8_9EIME|nr:hypothetical protein cyc_01621 [Cyclospora cayetanensis]
MRITVRPPGPVKCLFAVILAFSCFSWESLWGSHATGISRGPPTIQEGPIQTNYEAATAVGFAHRVPLWCKAFALEKAFSVCRGSNCKADNTSVLTQVFQDGACVLLILLMLILVADQVEWLLCQPLICWWVLSSVFGATIELPTAQIAPLLPIGEFYQLPFPYAYLICRLFLNEMYRHVALLKRDQDSRTLKKA